MKRTIELEGGTLSVSCGKGRVRLSLVAGRDSESSLLIGCGRNAADVGQLLVDAGKAMLQEDRSYRTSAWPILSRLLRLLERHKLDTAELIPPALRREMAHAIDDGDFKTYARQVSDALQEKVDTFIYNMAMRTVMEEGAERAKVRPVRW